MVNKWHIATNGHLSRNRFWDERLDKFYHPVQATTTVIQSEQYGNIVVDPSIPDPEEMGKAVFDCCGVKPEDVNVVYSTHLHFDHWSGLAAFPNAKCYMAKDDCLLMKSLREDMDDVHKIDVDRLIPADGELFPGFTLVPLPGHTFGLQGLLFDGPEGKVLCTGDSVMGWEHFQAREGYFFGSDMRMASDSVDKAAAIADFIIPGHGNGFVTAAYPQNKEKPVFEDGCGITLGDILNDPAKYAVYKKELDRFGDIQLKMGKAIDISVILRSAGFPEEKRNEIIEALKAAK